MITTINTVTPSNQKISIRDISDEHAEAIASLSLTHTYLISSGMLFSCCILPLLYFWFCRPMICKYFTSIRMLKGDKLTLEETQVDEVELTEFVPDEAPDRVNIRRDPLFDDVKIKAFHRRRHHLLRPPHRRQQQNGKKHLSNNKSEKEKEKNRRSANTAEEKGSQMAENSAHRSGKEQLTSTEITFSHQTQLHAL
ncbi:hypothetical protein ACH3XW_40580 [Acanthocheilonema viteae]